MAKKGLKKLKEYHVPTDRHALVIINPWGVPPGGFTQCTTQQWRGFYNNLASWIECACGIQPIGMWRTSEGGREQIFVEMPFGGNALTTTIPGTNDKLLTELGRRLLGAHHSSRFFWCPRAINAWQGHTVFVYEYDWKTQGDLDQKFDHFIQDTPALTDEFICRRGDNYPVPDAPPPKMVKWVLKLPSADAWATPAPMVAPPIDAPTPPPLLPSSRVASPPSAPEANIKRDPYEEEDELMQHVKIETEDALVKFEDPPEGKEEDSDLRINIKRDPYQEEDEQLDGLRDLERGHDLEQQQRAERWQPYETPLLSGMRQRDEELTCVKQENEDPDPSHDESASRRSIKQEEQSRPLYNEKDGRRVLADILRIQREDEIAGRTDIKQEEHSRPLYNEENGRRVLADLLRIQGEERQQHEVQSSQALPRVKLEPVDDKLPGQEDKRQRQRSQTLPSSSSPVRVRRESDDSRRSMRLASPTSQVDDFLNSCLSGEREEGKQLRHIDDDKARWGDRERSRDGHEHQRDRRIEGRTQKRNDERRRGGDLRHDEDKRHDERRPTIKREPVDLPPSNGRTRDPRQAHGTITDRDPRVRIKREMDDGSAASLNGRSAQWKRIKREV
ncbi:hypothetical protein IW261DRAFT_1460286 [Armillaria novae-zelandiae]|uniref:Uncharacterized protein n=1 Tax=Armillaria novae-zelandiae TaxID=153914 RepID=A0AA39PJW0_9AGAR|nr:hypothetical protein IW261DRAFT_1460286 [Armillaria novae-zelandiae]